MTIGSYSADGGRPVNEDSLFADARTSGQFLLMVADGLGGHGDGDKASALAVKHYFEPVPEFCSQYF